MLQCFGFLGCLCCCSTLDVASSRPRHDVNNKVDIVTTRERVLCFWLLQERARNKGRLRKSSRRKRWCCHKHIYIYSMHCVSSLYFVECITVNLDSFYEVLLLFKFLYYIGLVYQLIFIDVLLKIQRDF